MEQSKKTSFDFYMLPLVLAVAVVPLLTMMTAYSSGIGKYTWASGGSFVDFFLGFKRGALILLGAVIIILFCAAQWMRVQAKAVTTSYAGRPEGMRLLSSRYSFSFPSSSAMSSAFAMAFGEMSFPPTKRFTRSGTMSMTLVTAS